MLIRRIRPNVEPYVVTPGGGVELGDAGERKTLERELMEEFGATAAIGERVAELFVDGTNRSVFYRATCIAIDPSLRHGMEFSDPQNGTYELIHVPLDKIMHPDFPLRPIERKRVLWELFALIDASELD